MTKDIFTLIKLYKYFEKNDKLWKLLNTDNNRHLFLNNIDILKEEHNQELYDYFIEHFYITLKIDKKREIYKKASEYAKAILKLNNGKKLINNLIKELKSSEYKKCSALFDEIDKLINN